MLKEQCRQGLVQCLALRSKTVALTAHACQCEAIMSTAAYVGGVGRPRSPKSASDQPPMSTSTLMQVAAPEPSQKFYARFYSGPKDLHLLVFKQLSSQNDAGLLLARVMQVCKQWRSLLSGARPSFPPLLQHLAAWACAGGTDSAARLCLDPAPSPPHCRQRRALEDRPQVTVGEHAPLHESNPRCVPPPQPRQHLGYPPCSAAHCRADRIPSSVHGTAC